MVKIVKHQFNLSAKFVNRRHNALFKKARMFEMMEKEHDLIMDDQCNLTRIETSSGQYFYEEKNTSDIEVDSKFNLANASKAPVKNSISYKNALLNNSKPPVNMNANKARWIEKNKNLMVNDIEDFPIQYFNPHDTTYHLEDKDVFLQPEWNWCVLGTFGGRFPRMKAINDLVISWGVPCKVSSQPNSFVLFRFKDLEAKKKVIENGPYNLFGKRLFLKELQEDYILSKDVRNDCN